MPTLRYYSIESAAFNREEHFSYVNVDSADVFTVK